MNDNNELFPFIAGGIILVGILVAVNAILFKRKRNKGKTLLLIDDLKRTYRLNLEQDYEILNVYIDYRINAGVKKIKDVVKLKLQGEDSKQIAFSLNNSSATTNLGASMIASGTIVEKLENIRKGSYEVLIEGPDHKETQIKKIVIVQPL